MEEMEYVHDTRCMTREDICRLSDKTYRNIQGKNLPSDIRNLRDRETLKFQIYESMAVNEDFLEEQLKIEASESERNFRDYLFDIVYDIRTWLTSADGLREIAKKVVDEYDVSLIENEDFYMWCTSYRDDDYVYLTNILLKCIDVTSNFNIGKNLSRIINDTFGETYGVKFPIMTCGNFRKSLRDYEEGRFYHIKKHHRVSIEELRRLKEKIYKRLESESDD